MDLVNSTDGRFFCVVCTVCVALALPPIGKCPCKVCKKCAFRHLWLIAPRFTNSLIPVLLVDLILIQHVIGLGNRCFFARARFLCVSRVLRWNAPQLTRVFSLDPRMLFSARIPLLEIAERRTRTRNRFRTRRAPFILAEGTCCAH